MADFSASTPNGTSNWTLNGMIESNQTHLCIKDYANRTDILRGYL